MDITPPLMTLDRYNKEKFEQKLDRCIELASSLHDNLPEVSDAFEDNFARNYIQDLIRYESNTRETNKPKEYKILSKIEKGLESLSSS
ncbi:MAG: hypothetical protein AAFY76_09165, partial [Cyanobacteria bacterium J06649_11]